MRFSDLRGRQRREANAAGPALKRSFLRVPGTTAVPSISSERAAQYIAVRRPRWLGSLAIVMLLAGCGGGGQDAPGGDATVSTKAAGATEGRPLTNTKAKADGPFDLSVLGPEWKAEAKPFEPPEPRPSDCPEFDGLKADFHKWATTQQEHRVAGVLVLHAYGRAPTAADAAAYLERRSKITSKCFMVRYQAGGVTLIQPASTRVNQATYAEQDDGLDQRREIITIKGEWVSKVTHLESAQLVADIDRTLFDQARQ